ncbi:MAG: DedA family protein [Gammaproteobacteria bacterium]|nr:DedA family protein [Gammaproteobacteria bacterium]
MDSVELWALFSSSFLASTLLPGGSEVALAYLSQTGGAAPELLWATATLGNTLGGLTSWGLGWWLSLRRPQRTWENPRQEKALQQIRRYGGPALLFSWVPLVGDPLCLAAGWTGIRFFPALFYIGLGKGLRYALLLYMLPIAV